MTKAEDRNAVKLAKEAPLAGREGLKEGLKGLFRGVCRTCARPR